MISALFRFPPYLPPLHAISYIQWDMGLWQPPLKPPGGGGQPLRRSLGTSSFPGHSSLRAFGMASEPPPPAHLLYLHTCMGFSLLFVTFGLPLSLSLCRPLMLHFVYLFALFLFLFVYFCGVVFFFRFLPSTFSLHTYLLPAAAWLLPAKKNFQQPSFPFLAFPEAGRQGLIFLVELIHFPLLQGVGSGRQATFLWSGVSGKG